MDSRKIFILCVCLFFLGCSSAVEKTSYYSLNLPAQEGDRSGMLGTVVQGFFKALEASPKGKEAFPSTYGTLGIERFQSDAPLSHEEILVREGTSTEIYRSSIHFWWALPSEMVTEKAYEYLSDSGIFKAVFLYPTSIKIDYLLNGRLRRFEIVHNEDKESEAVIELEFYLTDQKRDNLVWRSAPILKRIYCPWDMEKASFAMGKALLEVLTQLKADITNAIGQQSTKDEK